MKILVADIPEDGLFLEGTLDPEPYDMPRDLRCKGIDYQLQVHVTPDDFAVTGTLDARLTPDCARCMNELPWEVNISDFGAHFERHEIEAIDLTVQIREDILLNLPIAPRCQLDEQQRCPYTGESHAAAEDDFTEKTRENVWGALEKLKPKDNNGSSKT